MSRERRHGQLRTPSLDEIASSDYVPSDLDLRGLKVPRGERGLPNGDWLIMAMNCKVPLIRVYARQLLKTLAEMPERDFEDFACELAAYLVDLGQRDY